MAIVKNSFRVSRIDGNFFSPGTVSSAEDEEDSESLMFSSEGGSASDADSGMGSDEIDLSEFGEPGMEFCQVGNQGCGIPLELYDLADLGAVLSLETWNECLTEEERFALSEYLPDMDQEGFAVNLKELFCGKNFHFGIPVVNFFNMLRGGFCDPRVVLYRQGLNLFQRRQHYHMLRKYHNSMVGSLFHIKHVWQDCNGYGVEEKLRVLNIRRRKKSFSYNKSEGLGSETNSDCDESSEAYSIKRLGMSHRKSCPKGPFEVSSLGNRLDMESIRFGNEKSRGILKVAAPKGCKNSDGNFTLLRDNGAGKKAETQRPSHAVYRKGYYSGLDLHNGGGQGDWNTSSRTKIAKSGLIKSKNQKDSMKSNSRDMQSVVCEDETEKRVQLPDFVGKGRNSDQEVTVASYDCHPGNSLKKLKHSDKNLKHHAKDGFQHELLKASQAFVRTFRHNKGFDESVPQTELDVMDERSIRGKKRKAGENLRSSVSGSGFDFSAEMGEPFFNQENRRKFSKGKVRDKPSHHLVVNKEYLRASSIYSQSEETESDSSDQVEEDGDGYRHTSRSGFPSAASQARQSGIAKPVHDLRKATKSAKSKNQNRSHLPDGGLSGSRSHTAKDESCCINVKKKCRGNYNSYLHKCKTVKKPLGVHLSEELQNASLGSYALDSNRNCAADLQSNEMCNPGSSILEKAENDFDANTSLPHMQRHSIRSVNRNQMPSDYAFESYHHQNLNGCNSHRKNIGNGHDGYFEDPNEPSYQKFSSKRQDELSSTTKKKGKRKADAISVSSHFLSPEPIILEKGASDLELDVKTPRKSFTLITPTIHTGFSFSIVHLLSAVRKALISPRIEDNGEIDNHFEKVNGEQKGLLPDANLMEGSILEPGGLTGLHPLTTQEIVNRVRSNPGDPCILETQEPLQDLIRGALRIFSSRTAPLGAKGWKALVSYEKSSKSWMWVGPLSICLSDNDNTEETSAEAWCIPHNMLVKLVDAFANWLKSGQETLQQIGSLPAPPAMLPVLDYKERFRDLRAQKSLNTIKPSSEEIRAYFRKEELLRYSIPDRAFQYTAFDGKKSIVAPLRRGGGKPTSKARDHFMLKPDRPPHVTVLCLVRDAAARLPGSVGTRADVCTLIRDSQFIVEDVTDAQINQVVSGALDRLHYERDPCVQFDGERKLWVYLHRDREDEDFEDDGTSSTKKWKRQRKDDTGNSDMLAATMNDPIIIAPGDLPIVGSSGDHYAIHPDLNVNSSDVNIVDNGELVYNDLRPTEENFQSYINTAHSERHHDNPISWEGLGSNHLLENKVLCLENSANDDFDDETFSRDRASGLLSGSLL